MSNPREVGSRSRPANLVPLAQFKAGEEAIRGRTTVGKSRIAQVLLAAHAELADYADDEELIQRKRLLSRIVDLSNADVSAPAQTLQQGSPLVPLTHSYVRDHSSKRISTLNTQPLKASSVPKALLNHVGLAAATTGAAARPNGIQAGVSSHVRPAPSTLNDSPVRETTLTAPPGRVSSSSEISVAATHASAPKVESDLSSSRPLLDTASATPYPQAPSTTTHPTGPSTILLPVAGSDTTLSSHLLGPTREQATRSRSPTRDSCAFAGVSTLRRSPDIAFGSTTPRGIDAAVPSSFSTTFSTTASLKSPMLLSSPLRQPAPCALPRTIDEMFHGWSYIVPTPGVMTINSTNNSPPATTIKRDPLPISNSNTSLKTMSAIINTNEGGVPDPLEEVKDLDAVLVTKETNNTKEHDRGDADIIDEDDKKHVKAGGDIADADGKENDEGSNVHVEGAVNMKVDVSQSGNTGLISIDNAMSTDYTQLYTPQLTKLPPTPYTKQQIARLLSLKKAPLAATDMDSARRTQWRKVFLEQKDDNVTSITNGWEAATGQKIRRKQRNSKDDSSIPYSRLTRTHRTAMAHNLTTEPKESSNRSNNNTTWLQPHSIGGTDEAPRVLAYDPSTKKMVSVKLVGITEVGHDGIKRLHAQQHVQAAIAVSTSVPNSRLDGTPAPSTISNTSHVSPPISLVGDRTIRIGQGEPSSSNRHGTGLNADHQLNIESKDLQRVQGMCLWQIERVSQDAGTQTSEHILSERAREYEAELAKFGDLDMALKQMLSQLADMTKQRDDVVMTCDNLKMQLDDAHKELADRIEFDKTRPSMQQVQALAMSEERMLQAKKAAEAELSAMKEALMEREKRFEQQLNQLDAERRHLQNTLVMEQAQVSALENQLSTTKMRADEWRKKAETLGRTIDTMLEEKRITNEDASTMNAHSDSDEEFYPSDRGGSRTKPQPGVRVSGGPKSQVSRKDIRANLVVGKDARENKALCTEHAKTIIDQQTQIQALEERLRITQASMRELQKALWAAQEAASQSPSAAMLSKHEQMEAQIKLLKKQLLQATQARDENKSAELMRARELAKCEKTLEKSQDRNSELQQTIDALRNEIELLKEAERAGQRSLMTALAVEAVPPLQRTPSDRSSSSGQGDSGTGRTNAQSKRTSSTADESTGTLTQEQLLAAVTSMRTAKEDAWRRARADRQELHEKGKEISALKDQLRNAAEEARVLSEAKFAAEVGTQNAARTIGEQAAEISNLKSQLASVRATLNAVENGSVTAVTRDRLPFNHLGQKRLESKIHADATPEDLRKELQDREMQIERLSSGLALLELKLQDALQNKRNDTAPQDSNMDKLVMSEVRLRLAEIRPMFGMVCGDVKDQTGVVVATVTANTPAWEAQLRPKDLIEAVNGHPVTGAAHLMALLRVSRPGDVLSLTVRKPDIPLNPLNAPPQPSIASNMAPTAISYRPPSTVLLTVGALGLPLTPPQARFLRRVALSTDSDAFTAARLLHSVGMVVPSFDAFLAGGEQSEASSILFPADVYQLVTRAAEAVRPTFKPQNPPQRETSQPVGTKSPNAAADLSDPSTASSNPHSSIHPTGAPSSRHALPNSPTANSHTTSHVPQNTNTLTTTQSRQHQQQHQEQQQQHGSNTLGANKGSSLWGRNRFKPAGDTVSNQLPHQESQSDSTPRQHQQQHQQHQQQNQQQHYNQHPQSPTRQHQNQQQQQQINHQRPQQSSSHPSPQPRPPHLNGSSATDQTADTHVSETTTITPSDSKISSQPSSTTTSTPGPTIATSPTTDANLSTNTRSDTIRARKTLPSGVFVERSGHQSDSLMFRSSDPPFAGNAQELPTSDPTRAQSRAISATTGWGNRTLQPAKLRSSYSGPSASVPTPALRAGQSIAGVDTPSSRPARFGSSLRTESNQQTPTLSSHPALSVPPWQALQVQVGRAHSEDSYPISSRRVPSPKQADARTERSASRDGQTRPRSPNPSGNPMGPTLTSKSSMPTSSSSRLPSFAGRKISTSPTNHSTPLIPPTPTYMKGHTDRPSARHERQPSDVEPLSAMDASTVAALLQQMRAQHARG